MNQALQSSPQGGLEESDRVNELVENYMKKNTELYDIETLIPVSNCGCLKSNIQINFKDFHSSKKYETKY